MTKLTIITGILIALSAPAMAEDGNTHADQRQENQSKRIEQGVKDGSLNKREAARLNRGQQHVQKIEDKASADGTITKKEAVRINKAQNVQSKRIARQKHDGQGNRSSKRRR